MEEILEQAKKLTDSAEVFMVTSESTPIQFETNRLKHAQTHQNTSISLRIVKQGRVGYSTGTQPDDISGLVNAAVETSQFGTECHFDFPSVVEYSEVKIFDPATPKVPLDAMTKLGDELISSLRSECPDLICQAWISKRIATIKIANSNGCQASYKQSNFYISVSGTLIRGTDMLFVGDGESSCHPIFKIASIVSNVKKQLAWSRDLATIPTGSFPVIFTSTGVVSALISPLISAFNGKTVLEGASPLGTRLGETFFSRKLTLNDDPTLPFRPSSRPCDDEGIPSQRTPLIKRGVVTNFLYDLQTAGLAGKRTTGSAGRGRGLPSPSPSAFVFTPGKTTLDEMISDMKNGLIVEELMGAEQGNILGGDFSGNVLLGFRVENGKIVGRVKNTMVSGNVYQLLKNLVAVGNDVRWLGGVYTPSLYFPSISVASK
jgi:PmbA protein